MVGLGHIAQVAVLPAFKHARRNSQLTALVSDDPVKLKELGRLYGVSHLYSYEEYEQCLQSGVVDAVYIALPNSLHREYAVKTAEAGIHVLCEKPLAITEEDCLSIIEIAQKANVKLMVAYRLHFEQANREVIDLIRSGRIGEPQIFNSVFSLQVREGNYRLQKEKGGGTLYDVGVYCINAARAVFDAEPEEAFAFSTGTEAGRFKEVDETTSSVLKFPNNKLASFACSFGAADAGVYQVIGTLGVVKIDPAFDYDLKLRYEITLNGHTEKRVVPYHDQFAPELIYFSDCVLNDVKPEPSGEEGLADVRVIRALYKSAQTGSSVLLEPFTKTGRQDSTLQIRKPPVSPARVIRSSSPKLTS